MKWYNSGTDICAEFAHGNYGVLQEYVENNANAVISEQKDDGDINDFLSIGRSVLRRFQQRCIRDEAQKVIFALGELNGIVKAYAHLDYEKAKNEYAWEQSSKLYGSVKHLNEIVNALYEDENLSQSELAERLGLNASTLTEAMKKVANKELVVARRSGKFKFYSLSEYGRRYHDVLMAKQSELEKNKDRYESYYQKLMTYYQVAAKDEEYTSSKAKEKAQEDYISNTEINNKVVQFKRTFKDKNSYFNNTNKGGFDLTDAREN